GCHQIQKMLAGIAQEMMFFLNPRAEALCCVHEMRGFGYHFFAIEVETPVTGRPPRRSRRAELPHRAPRMDAQPVRRRSLVGVFVSDHTDCTASCNAEALRVSTMRGGGSFHPGRRAVNCVHVIERRW